MKTSQLFSQLVEDSKVIPPFINTRSREHHRAFNTLSTLIMLLTTLTTNTILTDKQIWTFLVEFEDMASAFDEITSLPLFMHCNYYINNIVEKSIQRALDLEEYENVSNLQRFLDLRKSYSVI